MRINFYDARLSEDGRTMLVKEKAINYATDKNFSSACLVKMLNDVVSLNTMAEEHCYMLALNRKAQLLGIFFISKGTVSETLLNPREIFMRALLIGASIIILCHNHPSFCATPSKADITITQQLKEVGELLGLPLADHIVIGGDSYFIFFDQGLL